MPWSGERCGFVVADPYYERTSLGLLAPLIRDPGTFSSEVRKHCYRTRKNLKEVIREDIAEILRDSLTRTEEIILDRTNTCKNRQVQKLTEKTLPQCALSIDKPFFFSRILYRFFRIHLENVGLHNILQHSVHVHIG